MQPPAEDFAKMLETLFHGNVEAPNRPAILTESRFNLDELDAAIARMKMNKSADECGLVAELLRHSPKEFRVVLLDLFNRVLAEGTPPESWRKTLFLMLPKSKSSKAPGDFRPIASLRLLYKVFAYLVLGRVEAKLEAAQPEEQHGFRPGHRIEEHLLTYVLLLERTLAANTPLWLVSLDLSKAFDRVSWPALWRALKEQGISDHLIWILQTLYHDQEGEVVGTSERSRKFEINAGVRQGCVLSPRLFCCVLQWAMRRWRRSASGTGWNLRDGLPNLLDLRFADDILLFGKTEREVLGNLDLLVHELSRVGLVSNASKTVVLTTQAQAPTEVCTPNGIFVQMVENLSFHVVVLKIVGTRVAPPIFSKPFVLFKVLALCF